MNLQQLKSILPNAVDPWAHAIIESMPRWSITGQLREAGFIAQLAVESLGLTVFEENLNYSLASLMRVWPNRFPTPDAAADYEHQPEKLANSVYANRNGNGSPETGDGWHYRGRGPIQITGRANYHNAGVSIGQELELYPELILRPAIGADVACWFWYSHSLNDVADKGDIEGMTRGINGGLTGLQERKDYYGKALSVLSDV